MTQETTGMPLNLIFVRHGQSEGNVANKQSRVGNHEHFENKNFVRRHSHNWRLTDKGREQAKKAGEYLKSFNLSFDRIYTSPYVRALETSYHLNLEQDKFFISDEIREREWGNLDRIPENERQEKFAELLKKREDNHWYWKPEEGESLSEVGSRVRDFLGTQYREMNGKNVLTITHAETMFVLMAKLERWSPEQASLIWQDKSRDIGNCSILHYSRINPDNGWISPYLDYIKIIRVATNEESMPWEKVIRRTYSNHDLKKMFEEHPQIIS